MLKDKDKDNTVVVTNDHGYLSNVIKCTKIPKSISPVFMEAEIGPILREHNLHLPIVTSQFSIVVQKLQAVIERLSANKWLEICVSTYIDVPSSNVRECLELLGLDYLEMSVFQFDNLQETDEVFKNNGSNVSVDCFVRIATESGFLDFIRFGNTVAERKKDAVKLFKLLKIFHTLNELRLDFNRLFGGKSCNGIQPSASATGGRS